MSEYNYDSINELAVELGRPMQTLLVLGRNRDPFYAGAPARRQVAEWFAEQYRRFGFSRGVHLRRIHYRLISQAAPIQMWNGAAYENTDECWKGMNYASMQARYLRLVDPSDFVDRRTEDPLVMVADDHDASIEIEGSQDFSLQMWQSLPALPRLSLTGPKIRQRYMVEIWVEKSTLSDILIPLHRRYGVNVVTGVGEMSDIRCNEFVDRAIEDGRPVRILYLSDFDPGGQSMPVAAARKIEFRLRADELDDLDIQVRPILLNHDQCVEYGLPRTPMKEGEKRAAKFEERFGEGATELDALEALHPGEISRILTDEIERYYDHSLAERVTEAEDDFQGQLDEINDRARQDHQEEFAELRRDYAALVQRFNAETVQIAERFNRVRRAVTELISENIPDPDDYEWPEPDEGDEDPDPLFDSTRDYVTQIDRYKLHQGKPTGRKQYSTANRVGIKRGPYKRKDQTEVTP